MSCTSSVSRNVGRLHDEWRDFMAASESLDQFHAGLPASSAAGALPRTRDPQTCRASLSRAISSRGSAVLHDGVRDLYAGTASS